MREFRQWQSYDRLEPFGEERADLRNAIVAWVVARTSGDKKSKVADYMPEFDTRPNQSDTSHLLAKFKQFKERHNRNPQWQQRSATWRSS